MKLYKLFILLGIMVAHAQDNYNLLVGTYTKNCDSKGIYVYNFNTETAELTLKNSTENVDNPSYLTVSPDNANIYCVNENGEKSYVSAFKYTPADGSIEFMNKKSSEGADPCYIINDETNVIVADYSGGSLAVFAKKDDGSLADPVQVIKHEGSSVNAKRQEAPHVHMVYFSPDKKYVLCNDLGTDKIYLYKYTPNAGKETLVLKSTIDQKPGSGPRHLVFNPNGIFLYVLHELDASLTVYEYDDGKMTQIQEESVAPRGFDGVNGAADIHFSPDGKFLYATNRGEANSISVFQVYANGMIKLIQELPTGGEAPRNFAIGPKGNFLLIGNQNSNYITIFKRDKDTGMLSDTGNKVEICSPVCLVFTENK